MNIPADISAASPAMVAAFTEAYTEPTPTHPSGGYSGAKVIEVAFLDQIYAQGSDSTFEAELARTASAAAGINMTAQQNGFLRPVVPVAAAAIASELGVASLDLYAVIANVALFAYATADGAFVGSAFQVQ